MSAALPTTVSEAGTGTLPPKDDDQPSSVASTTGSHLTKTARMFQTMKHRLSVIQRKLQEEEIHEEEEVLQLLRRDIDDADVEEFWRNVDYHELTTWSLRELKIACAARRLDQSGRKLDLIDRLMQRKLKEEKIREREMLRLELTRQRENEADGSVYCCGVGYGEQCTTWDRLWVRRNLTCIQALSGIGVESVSLGLDSTVCYALCGNGEIWSWGVLRSDERGPVGYPRKLVYHTKTVDDLPTYQHGRMTKTKVGSTPVGLPAIPIRQPIQDKTAAAESAAQEAKRQKALKAARIAGLSGNLDLDAMIQEPKEMPWVTEESVLAAEKVRIAKAEEAKRLRILQRREKIAKYKASHYDLEPLAEDDGRDLGELLQLDTGYDNIDPLAKYPEGRLPKGHERPGIATGAAGQRLAELSDRPPPAIDEGKSWWSLSLGKLGRSLKSAAIEVVKATPVISDYLDDDDDTKAKMNAKYGSPSMRSSASTPNGSLMLADAPSGEGISTPTGSPAKPKGLDMIARTVPDNVDWEDTKHKSVLFDPFDEKRRTIAGGENWYQGYDTREVVAEEMKDYNFVPPMPIESLTGEVPVSIVGSRSHAMALTKGGDVFIWGSPEGGMLGVGGVNEYVEAPMLMNYIPAEKIVTQVSCGLNHTAAVATDGELYVWGFPAEGRLGLGNVKNYGPPIEMIDADRRSGVKAGPALGVTVPVSVSFFRVNRIMVKSVSCGTAHTVALTLKGVFSWGCNDGGRLGVGDQRNRDMPIEVTSLRGKVVLQVAAGAWHSAALVLIPPYLKGGWVYTWGTGLYGQLGHGNIERTSLVPKLVEELVDREVVISNISCGMYHMGCLSENQEGWTWGKDDNGCLGRPGSMRDIGGPEFSGIPGRVETLREYGIGPVLSIACGFKTTVIATGPFKPLLPFQVRERARLDLAREAQSERLYQLAHEDDRRAAELAAEKRRKQRLLELNMARPLCSTCYKCKGFQPTLFRPMVCDLCGHDRKAHTKHRILHPEDVAKAAASRTVS